MIRPRAAPRSPAKCMPTACAPAMPRTVGRNCCSPRAARPIAIITHEGGPRTRSGADLADQKTAARPNAVRNLTPRSPARRRPPVDIDLEAASKTEIIDSTPVHVRFLKPTGAALHGGSCLPPCGHCACCAKLSPPLLNLRLPYPSAGETPRRAAPSPERSTARWNATWCGRSPEPLHSVGGPRSRCSPSLAP